MGTEEWQAEPKTLESAQAGMGEIHIGYGTQAEQWDGYLAEMATVDEVIPGSDI